MLEILLSLAALVAAFASQVYLIKCLTAFVKEVSGLKGNAVRILAFCVGLVIGALFLWPWVVLNSGLHLSVYVLISVLFLIVAGLTASGGYDLANDPDTKWRRQEEELNKKAVAVAYKRKTPPHSGSANETA